MCVCVCVCALSPTVAAPRVAWQGAFGADRTRGSTADSGHVCPVVAWPCPVHSRGCRRLDRMLYTKDGKSAANGAIQQEECHGVRGCNRSGGQRWGPKWVLGATSHPHRNISKGGAGGLCMHFAKRTERSHQPHIPPRIGSGKGTEEEEGMARPGMRPSALVAAAQEGPRQTNRLPLAARTDEERSPGAGPAAPPMFRPPTWADRGNRTREGVTEVGMSCFVTTATRSRQGHRGSRSESEQRQHEPPRGVRKGGR